LFAAKPYVSDMAQRIRFQILEKNGAGHTLLGCFRPVLFHLTPAQRKTFFVYPVKPVLVPVSPGCRCLPGEIHANEERSEFHK